MTKLTDNPRSDQMTPGDPDAMAPSEVISVTSKRVKCDGGGGALGHPVVFYDMGEETFVECLYCDRRFVLADEPFAIENEQLTPSLKIRRHVIRGVYSERLDALYKA